VLVMTEFGRTPSTNASGGTDHGRAAAWMVLGPRVRGGIHLGSGGWPGLATEQGGRHYLSPTVDYRDVYAELLGRHLGAVDPPAILAGYAATTVGFIA
jgi:uncharacterized protein (DUF1501 family)